jgi:hypothetical protein
MSLRKPRRVKTQRHGNRQILLLRSRNLKRIKGEKEMKMKKKDVKAKEKKMTKHMDEKQDKKLIKKMVKKDCM